MLAQELKILIHSLLFLPILGNFFEIFKFIFVPLALKQLLLPCSHFVSNFVTSTHFLLSFLLLFLESFDCTVLLLFLFLSTDIWSCSVDVTYFVNIY